jgi:hypothetical protein
VLCQRGMAYIFGKPLVMLCHPVPPVVFWIPCLQLFQYARGESRINVFD